MITISACDAGQGQSTSVSVPVADADLDGKQTLELVAYWRANDEFSLFVEPNGIAVSAASGRQWTSADALELSILTTIGTGVACGTGTTIIAPPNDIKVARQESLRIWYGRTMSAIDVNFGVSASPSAA